MSKSDVNDPNNDPTQLRPRDDEATRLREPRADDATEVVRDAAGAATEIVDENATRKVDLDATVAAEASPLGSNPLAAMRPGYMLKQRFRLEEKLGEGGMGAVFRAVDMRKVEAQHAKPHVAIKLITGAFAQDARAFIALQRETDKSQTLAHPNIITVYDFDRDGDVFFMTMESLVGKTLDAVIRDPERERSKAIAWIEDIAGGIAYAHKRNIVHSDLKPPNIFLTTDGNIKVLDFGIARACSSIEGAAAPQDPGEIAGLTPGYASCEMFEQKDPHPADDVYAIGLIAYELLTGEHPFGRKKAIDARAQGLKPKRIKGLKSYQWDAIAKALAFDRSERWQDAEQFRRRFTGTGRRVKQLSAALLVAVLSFAAYTVFYQPEAGPDIPFAELPAATQQQVLDSLAEGRQALRFGDLNGALFYFDRAYNLHPRNQEVTAELEALLDKLLATIETRSGGEAREAARTLVGELLKYESLTQNPRLMALQKELAQAP